MTAHQQTRFHADLSVQEAAERSGFHHTTIRRWIKNGILPSYRSGPRLIRIRAEDLDALVGPREGAAS